MKNLNEIMALDYSTNSWMPDKTKMFIYYFIRDNEENEIIELMDWLYTNKNDFFTTFQNFITARLLEFDYFDISEKLLNEKKTIFNLKTSDSCISNFTLNFKQPYFDYWLSKINQYNENDKNTTIKNFWKEFLSYQFLRDEDVENNITNLHYVFDKIPFYKASNYDMFNGYLIKFREDFINQKSGNLSPKNKQLVIENLSYFCGVYYPNFKSTFEEEFQKYPDAVYFFNKGSLLNKLDDNLSHKKNNSKTKI